MNFFSKKPKHELFEEKPQKQIYNDIKFFFILGDSQLSQRDKSLFEQGFAFFVLLFFPTFLKGNIIEL